MSENVSVTQKEDLAWASYVLLRNTNTMSVLIAIEDVICVRGYWNMPEDVSKPHIVEWFKSQIQQAWFLDLEDTLRFPQKPDSGMCNVVAPDWPYKEPQTCIVQDGCNLVVGFLTIKSLILEATDSQLRRMLPRGTPSLLVQPVLNTSVRTNNVTKMNAGFVLLVSSADCAHGEKNRAWIRAVVNKFQGYAQITVWNLKSIFEFAWCLGQWINQLPLYPTRT